MNSVSPSLARRGVARGSEEVKTVIVMSSCARGDAFAQQPGGAEDQHGDQHQKREYVLVVAAEYAAGQLAEIAGAQRFEQPQQQTAEHGAAQVADAAEHGGGKGFDAGQKPIEKPALP